MNVYSTVVLTIPDKDGFTYRIPEQMRGAIVPGLQVVVPFKNRYVSGVVLTTHQELPSHLREEKIKLIRDIVHPEPIVSSELIALLNWITDYYICHLGEAFRLIQSSLNVGSSRLMVRRIHDTIPDTLTSGQIRILKNIPVNKEISVDTLEKKVAFSSLRAMLLQLEKDGLLQRYYTDVSKKQSLKVEEYFSVASDSSQELNRQKQFDKITSGPLTQTRLLLEFLNGKEWVSYSQLKAHGFSRRAVNRLLQLKLIQKQERQRHRTFDLPYGERIQKIQLTPDQQQFIEKAAVFIEKKEFRTFLLHGITGSGKTQIYIELIAKVLAQNRQAIVLIPEIVLTPQTLSRFRHYFGEQVGILHSRLSQGEKREILSKIRQGKYRVVIGPRSAIFSPVQQLGLVIVDEEHETSYKQSDSRPHYHARDVAIYRAQLNGAVVVLGSATPSFESLHNAKVGHYDYFNLIRRVEAQSLPRISIVDLRQEWNRGAEQPVISEHLELKIESRLLIKEQVMILQNRRGFAPYLLCKECGFIIKCPHCDITLTYHRSNRKLLCHYCGYTEKAPDVCPECQGLDILYKGIGTQQLEQVINEKFSHARVLRMDQDTTRRKHGHLEILEKFRRGDAEILLGTKMIAKGLDFRKLSLVGIISADQGLHFPDFRANEKVFQLLTQAAGRAGRGESNGEVVVQSLDPGHFIFHNVLTHDYLGFYEKEIESRKALGYPPFSRLLLIRVEGKSLKNVQQYSQSVCKFLWKANSQKRFSILGPAPAPIARIQDKHRYHILIKQDKSRDASMAGPRKIVKQGLLKHPDLKKWPVKVTIVVDPVEIL